MSVKVKIAPILRKSTNGQELVEVTGHSPMECLHALEVQFPNIKRWLYDKEGKLQPQVLLFVNGERIHTGELKKPLNDGDELSILVAIGGG